MTLIAFQAVLGDQVVSMPVMQLLDMAGMKGLIPSPQRAAQPSSRYGNYGPAALSNGSPPANGAPSRRISGDRPPPQMAPQTVNQPVR